MKRIAIDMDDVIADATQKFCDIYKADFGITIEKHDLIGKEFMEVVALANQARVHEYPYQKGFFSDLPVIPHAQEVMQKLSKKYEIYIASAATEFPNSFKEKHDWLKEHFPFISWHNIVFCGDKSILKADYLIDDRLKNLKVFDGKAIVFTAPHNLKAAYEPFARANNWLEIEKMLL
jgi:5'(3')-deoxyribonucleotidase